MISADDSPPYDRPNLSKDFLAGKAQDDWIPLRPPEYYRDQRIDLVLDSQVGALDIRKRRVELENGKTYGFGRSCSPPAPSPSSCPSRARRTARFITFAPLPTAGPWWRKRNLPSAWWWWARASLAWRLPPHCGRAASTCMWSLRRSSRWNAFWGRKWADSSADFTKRRAWFFIWAKRCCRIDGRTVTLQGGSTLEADFIVVGVGVRPSVALAEQAGLAIDRGITVNEYLETSAPGVFAAGDIARWPDPHSGERIRVEHWVVAERQGQTAAKTSSAGANRLPPCPSSGASTTTWPSTMLATRKNGIRLPSMGNSPRRISLLPTGAATRPWPSPRSRAICKV